MATPVTRTPPYGAPRPSVTQDDEDEQDDAVVNQGDLPPPIRPISPVARTRPYVRPAYDTGQRLSDDPNERAQESMARAEADFAARQYATNPFLYSGAVKSLAKEGGRKYMDRAVREGEQAYAQQVQNDRAQAVARRQQEVEDQKATNASREANLRATGQKFYTDPYGNIQPVLDTQGRALYAPTTWARAEHPKDKRPVLEKRDQYGQRQFKNFPLTTTDDPNDMQMYWDVGDGESVPAMSIDEAVKSPDLSVARKARVAQLSKMRGQKQQQVAATYQEVKAIDLERETEAAKAQTMLQRADQLSQAGGDAGEIEKLTTEAYAIQDSLDRKTGELGQRKMIADARHLYTKTLAERDGYLLNQQEIAERLVARGIDPETDPIYRANQQGLASFEKALQFAKKGLADVEGLRNAPVPVAPAAPAEEIGTVGGLVNVGKRAARQSLAGMDVMGAVARGGKEQDYANQATLLEQQAANIDTLQPNWTPEKRSAWVKRAMDTASKLRARSSAMGQSKAEQISGAAGQLAEAGKIKGAAGYEDYANARGMEAVKRFFSNPVEVASNIAVEGALGSIPALAGTIGGGVTAGIPGAAAGAGIGSLATEYASTLMDTFGAAGVNVQDPADLLKAFGDDRLMSVARKRGLARGIPVAVFDALSGGLAGRSVAPVVKSGMKQVLKAGGVELAEQAGLGMAGETAGQVGEQIADTGSVDPSKLNFKDIFAEGIGEVVPGAVQIGAGAAARGRGASAAPEDMGGDAQAAPLETPPAPVSDETAEAEFQRALEASDLSPEERALFNRLRNEGQPVDAKAAIESNIVGAPAAVSAEESARTIASELPRPDTVVSPPLKSAEESAGALLDAEANEARGIEDAQASEAAKEQRIQTLVDELSAGNDAERSRLLAFRSNYPSDIFLAALEGAADFRRNPAGQPDVVAAGVQREVDAARNAPITGETPGVTNVGRIIPAELEIQADLRATDEAERVARAMADAGGREAYRPDMPEQETILRDEPPTPAADSAAAIEAGITEEERLRRSGVGYNKLALDLQRQAALSNENPVPQSTADESAGAAPEVSGREPEQPAPDVPAREELADVALGRPPVETDPKKIAADRKKYDVLQRRLSSLLKKGGRSAAESSEYQTAWQQSEDIKNRHGGMPPGEVSAENWVRGESQRNSNGDLFFTTSDEIARDFGEARPIKESERPKNTLNVDDKIALAELLGYDGDPLAESLDTPAEKRFDVLAKAYAKGKGHDSIRYENGTFGEPELHVFRNVNPTERASAGVESAPASAELRKNNAGADLPPVSSLTAAQKLAELKAGGITTYAGNPIADANPAQLSNALGKFRRGELTPEGEKPGAPSGPLLTDRAIEALRKAKIDTKGQLFDVTGATAAVAYNAALDIAILGLRAGRPLEQIIRLAVARYRAVHQAATDEEVSALTNAITTAAQQPVEDAKKKKSAVQQSLKEAGLPVRNQEYDVRAQEERVKEASSFISKNGEVAAEAALADREIPADTRVAIGGELLRQKMEAMKKAKPEEAALLTKDIRRIAEATRSNVSTESGQGVAMHSRIYEDLGVKSSMDYVRSVQKNLIDKMGGAQAEAAAQEVADAFNKTKDQKARDAAIERLKKRYTEKPVTKMLNALKGLQRAQELNALGILTRDDMIDVAGKALGLPGVSGENLKRIATLVDRIEKAPNLAQAEEAQVELSNMLADFKGLSKIDLETAQMTLNVLASTNTQAANAAGNALRLITEIASVAAVNPTSARQKALWSGFKDGLPLGWDQAKSIWQTGRGTRDLQDKTIGTGSEVERADYRDLYPNMPGMVADALNLKKDAMARVGRFMRSVDALAYYPAREAYARMVATKYFEGDLKGTALEKQVAEVLHTTPKAIQDARQQAKSEGYTGISVARRASEILEARRKLTPEGEKAANESERFAADTTYTNEPEGIAGIIYRAASDTVGKVRIEGVPILKPWMMFLRTPANIYNAAKNYTPAGFYEAAKGETLTQDGKRALSDDEINRRYFQASIGSALMASAFVAVAKGLMDITEKGPEDPEKRRQLMAAGWRPYSVRIGNGPYVSYRDTPLITALSAVGIVADDYKYNGAAKKDIGQQVASALVEAPLKAAFATSPMTGLAELLDSAVSGKSNGLTRTLAGIPANVAIPGVRLASEVDRYSDPTVYDSNPLQQTVPFLRREGEPRSDVQGRTVESRPSDRFVGVPSDDKLDRVLADRGLFIPGVGSTIKLGREEATDEQKEAYKRLSGQRIRQRLLAMVPMLQRLDMERAQEAIDRVTREERDRAKGIVRRMPAPKS